MTVSISFHHQFAQLIEVSRVFFQEFDVLAMRFESPMIVDHVPHDPEDRRYLR